MNVDRSILDNLSQEQILFAADFLENIFLHNKKNIMLPDQVAIDAVVIMLKSSKKDILTSSLFSALSQSFQNQLLDQFQGDDKYLLVCLLVDLNDIKYIFDKFNEQEKKIFLEFMYEKNTLLYKNFTDFINPSIDIVEGVIIDQPKVAVADIIKDVSLLTDLVINDDQSVDDCRSYAQVLINKYQLQDLTIFVREFIVMVRDMKLSLSSRHDFFIYIKFYNLVQLFVSINDDYLEYLYPVIDQFLLAMSSIEGIEWRIKLFEQLPEFIIRICLEKLSKFETISNQKQRNFYCKLFNDFKDNLDHKDVNNIKFAFDQL